MPTLAQRLGVNEPNSEQLAAINAIDGPVLVVAGPGTGKTQLLGLRFVNILAERDIDASNILCLTYMEAGAEAMRKRLLDFIGRDAYLAEISTFHGFCRMLRSRYPEYFALGAFESLVTNLEKAKLINQILRDLPLGDPLYGKSLGEVSPNYGSFDSFVSHFKRSGLSTAELRAIAQQNLDFFDYIDHQSRLPELLAIDLKTAKKGEKIERVEEVLEYLRALDGLLPASLSTPVTGLPGSYEPYARYLVRRFTESELYSDAGAKGRFTVFGNLRKELFELAEGAVGTGGGGTGGTAADGTAADGGTGGAGTAADGAAAGGGVAPDPANSARWVCKQQERRTAKRLLSAADCYEQYQAALKERGLYDFDDMVLDAIQAIRANPGLKTELQQRYRYLMVDEFQDTNGAQMEIVRLLCDSDAAPNLLAVGDDDQAITRFQGAAVEYLNQFEQAYQGVRRIVLNTNYRSTPDLVDLGQQVAQQIEGRSEASRSDKQLVAARRPDAQAAPAIQAFSYPGPDEQYYALAAELQARIAAGALTATERPDEALAVIARKHKGLRRLIPYLNALGVPFNYRVAASVFQVQSIQTLLACLRFSAYYALGRFEMADAELPQIISAPEFGVSPEEYFDFALRRKQKNKTWLEMLQEGGQGSQGQAAPAQAAPGQAAPAQAQAAPGQAAQRPGSRLKAVAEQLRAFSFLSLNALLRSALAQIAQPFIRYYEAQAATQPEVLLEFQSALRALIEFVEGEYQISTQPLRLADTIRILDECQRFEIDINAQVNLRKKAAVNLLTAHGSKGLEFDNVFVIDVDQDSWHRQYPRSSLIARNLLFADEGDADDVRRLLFVALTRARFGLQLYLGKGGLIGELVEAGIEVEERALDMAEMTLQVEVGWQDRYLPAGDLVGLLIDSLKDRKVSVSLLNSFLEYRDDDTARIGFLSDQAFAFPSSPKLSLVFGSLVHSFLEEYLNHVVKQPVTDLDTLVGRCQEKIMSSDLDDPDKQHALQRFASVVQGFLPAASAYMTPEAEAEGWHEAVLTGDQGEQVPLVGKFDLLLRDEAAKEVRIFDYKTSKADTAKPSRAYLRQLAFYKLLIELDPAYAGYQVTASADLYVEPDQEQGGALPEPVFHDLSGTAQDHLAMLIKAVWYRLQHGLIDVSDFQGSEQLAGLRAASVYKSDSKGGKKGDPKEPSADELQACFEQWLIDQYQRGIGE